MAGSRYLEIGADQGAAIVELVGARLPGLGLPRRSGPGGAAAGRGRRAGTRMSLQDATRAAAIRGTEPGFPVRLVALDIDGTLVGDDLVVGPRTIAAIRAAKARGVAVSLVTGRMVSSAMRFARELGLTDPIIGYQGGLIRAMPEPGSARLGKLLVHTPLRPATARAVVTWTREHGLDPHLNHLERFILRADDPRSDDYSAFMGARGRAGARPARCDRPPDHEDPRGR